MIDVIVTGAAGRMGREVVKAVTAADGMRVAAAVDPNAEGTVIDDGAGGTRHGRRRPRRRARAAGIRSCSWTSRSRPPSRPTSRPPSPPASTAWSARQASRPRRWAALAATAKDGACLFVAPNFAIGAVLMMRFAQTAARYMPHAEIIELHHDRKLDAPSGTAMRTASLIAAARGDAPASPGRETRGRRRRPWGRSSTASACTRCGSRASSRTRRSSSAGSGQTLSIRHDSIDRTSFMPGVVLAVREVVGRSGPDRGPRGADGAVTTAPAPPNGIVVQKFGGTSVGTPEGRAALCAARPRGARRGAPPGRRRLGDGPGRRAVRDRHAALAARRS